MLALKEFQQAFAHALMVTPGARPRAPLAKLTAQPGFAVYRNTVLKGAIDALLANYPAVARITGEDWFRATALQYVLATPPDNPVLIGYGAAFAAFLARFEPARELPYLPGVARLDRLWIESHIARDDALLDAAMLAHMQPAQLANIILYPHAAARWAWFDDAPAFSIWSRNRAVEEATNQPWEPEWRAEGALLTRTQGAVEWIALDAATYAFLDHCASGGTISGAAAAALDADRDANLQQIIASLLVAGTFSHGSVTHPLKQQNLFKTIT